MHEQLGIGTGAGVAASGEAAVVRRLAQLSGNLNRPLCAFDVGANQGQFLELLLSELGGRDSEIHCFEPSRATFELLVKTHGNHQGVHLNPFGLGRTAGEFTLYSNGDGSGLASLTKRQLDFLNIDFSGSELVSIRTLDEYCAECGVETIDLLKIDVEGHELDVLNGGMRMLSERRVRLVQFEFGGCNIDTRTFVRDFWNLFAEIGMQGFFRIMPSGLLYRIDAYSEALEQFRTTNYLVVCDADLLP